MPPTKLTDRQRRELVLAVLRGERVADAASRYGVSGALVYRLVSDAREHAAEEHAFWSEVLKAS